MKKCSKCLIEKDFIDFGKDKKCKDGLKCWCKNCSSEYHKKYYKKYYTDNYEKEKVRGKKYREKNKEKISEYKKNWNDNNPEYFKKYKEENPEKIKEIQKRYADSHPESEKNRRKRWREKNPGYNKKYREENKEKIRKVKREYTNKRRESDVLFKLKDAIGHNIRECLKRIGTKKKNRTEIIIGCTIEELKKHLESKFEIWMNWENYGLFNGEINYGWDIDHIIPTSSAKTEDEILKLNHYSNLQPLCSKINRHVKSDTMD